MVLFLQTALSGLSNGAVYAALALALVVVFRASGHVNIAQGEMAMLATFLTLYLSSTSGGPQLQIWLAIVLSIIISAILGGVLQQLVVRHVDSKTPLAYLILTVGLLIVFNSFAILEFGSDPRRMKGLFPEHVFDVGGVRIDSQMLGMLATLLVAAALLAYLLGRTRLGLALRAVASNSESSRLAGIPYQRMLIISWGIAAGIGALAGALITTQTYVQPSMMLDILVYAFAAAILGGLDSALGAVIGGLVIGVVEALASTYVDAIGAQLKIIVPFVLILVVLLVRPTGLFGSRKVQRA